MLRAGELAAAELIDVLQVPPAVFRIDPIPRRIDELREVVLEPARASERFEAFRELTIDARQVDDVFECVIDLRGRQRASRPVGEGIGLLQAYAAFV